MDCLPEEVLEHILSQLSVTNELYSASQVCKVWRKMCFEIYQFKMATFRENARKGNMIWRDCTQQPCQRTHHFIPKHLKGNRTVEHLNIPSPRVFHGAAVYDNFMYIFGGTTVESLGPHNSTRSYFNDIYKFNMLTSRWEKIVASGGAPTPRTLFALTTYRDNIIVSGGCIGSTSLIRSYIQEFNDVYIYNIPNNSWSKAGHITKRYLHRCTCLNDRMVVFGGMRNIHGMSCTLEVCKLLKTLDHTTIVTETVPYTVEGDGYVNRSQHLQVKVDGHRILIYGGETSGLSPTSGNQIRVDACLLEFGEDYTSAVFTKVQVLNLEVGLYPASVEGGVRVGDAVIFLTRPVCIKQHSELPGLYQLDTDRTPNGDAAYKQDYYHTFVLDIANVAESRTVTWQHIANNPPPLAPRNSIFHTTVVGGDSLYVFGGCIKDRRTQQSKASNNLYKVNVFRTKTR